MNKRAFSPSVLKISAAFLTDLAVVVFVGVFPSVSPVELTERVIAVILCLYSAIILDKGASSYDHSRPD